MKSPLILCAILTIRMLFFKSYNSLFFLESMCADKLGLYLLVQPMPVANVQKYFKCFWSIGV